jgi:hypothetical protein
VVREVKAGKSAEALRKFGMPGKEAIKDLWIISNSVEKKRRFFLNNE